MQTHSSNPFNPLIANAFYRSGFIESWGRGIKKICDACLEHGIPLPEYVVHPEDIMVTMHGLAPADETEKNKKPSKAPKSPNRPSKASTQNSDRIAAILFLIDRDPSITKEEIGLELGISFKQVRTAMEQMIDAGMISRAGGKRYGQWIIIGTNDK